MCSSSGVPSAFRTKPMILISLTQQGFRPNHSTFSNLLPLAHNIDRRFNQLFSPYLRLTMAMDFSNAFYMVNTTKLISAVIDSLVNNNSKRGLCAYLKSARSQRSIELHARMGSSQGTCLVYPLPYSTSFCPRSPNTAI